MQSSTLSLVVSATPLASDEPQGENLLYFLFGSGFSIVESINAVSAMSWKIR